MDVGLWSLEDVNERSLKVPSTVTVLGLLRDTQSRRDGPGRLPPTRLREAWTDGTPTPLPAPRDVGLPAGRPAEAERDTLPDVLPLVHSVRRASGVRTESRSVYRPRVAP